MPNNLEPLVSVIMPAYNREQYIAEAIEAVLISSYKNFELIIVDDCSSDGTVAIAKRYAGLDKRIKLYINEKNLDQFPNRNKAASYVSGDIIICADSDDRINKDAIEYIVNHFMVHPEIKFATMYLGKDIMEPTILTSEESIRKHFYDDFFLQIGPAGTIIKKNFFQTIGGFPERYGPAGDLYYNIKAASNTDVLLLPYAFFYYRRHEGQEINKKYAYLYNNYKYYEDIMRLPELPLTMEERKRLLRKNKRNFLFQSLVYLKNTGEIMQTLKAFKLAGFGMKQIMMGIFQ